MGVERKAEKLLRIAAQALQPSKEMAVASENFVKHPREAGSRRGRIDQKHRGEQGAGDDVRAQSGMRRILTGAQRRSDGDP